MSFRLEIAKISRWTWQHICTGTQRTRKRNHLIATPTITLQNVNRLTKTPTTLSGPVKISGTDAFSERIMNKETITVEQN